MCAKMVHGGDLIDKIPIVILNNWLLLLVWIIIQIYRNPILPLFLETGEVFLIFFVVLLLFFQELIVLNVRNITYFSYFFSYFFLTSYSQSIYEFPNRIFC
jgi:hypothetical protein